MRTLTLAVAQMKCTWDRDANIHKAEAYIREGVGRGAQVVLLQELFETPYFCQVENPEYFALASPLEENPGIRRIQELASELRVVVPVSFFEKANQGHYNSLAMVDADGCLLGVYRKNHIPDGPGYEEKYYFNPGDLGIRIWKTRYAILGVGICWDQWYPELARAMVLMGAEILLYPTAIGTEPQDSSLDSMEHWRTVQRGHAAANLVPVAAANRVGTETLGSSSITFYGSSFITDERGTLLEEADRDSEGLLIHSFDLDRIAQRRASWGIFRDRRPELYTALLSYDGIHPHPGIGGTN